MIDYQIIKCGTDYHQFNLTDIWKEALPALDDRRIVWTYQNNPAGHAELYLLKDKDQNRIFGVCATIPKYFQVNGVARIGGMTADFAVLEKYRILGPALALQREIMKTSAYDFLIGIPNSNSYGIQKRIGYSDLCKMTRFVKLFRSKNALKKYYEDSPKRFIWPLIDIYFRFRTQAMTKKRIIASYLESAASFDEEFSEIRLDEQIDFTGSRGSQYLNWRFIQNPYQDYSLLKFKKPGNKNLDGYIIYHLKDNIAYVDDFSLREHVSDLRILFDAFSLYAIQHKFHGVSVMVNSNYMLLDIFRKSGFYEMKTRLTTVFHNKATAGFDSKNIFLTGGDFDIDIS
jgi:hypothetical protein